MICFTYPITHDLRGILLLVEWIFIFLCFELGIIFLLRLREEVKKGKINFQELSYVSLFLSYSLTWIFFLIGNYYAADYQTRSYFLSVGFFTQMIGLILFSFCMERQQIFLGRSYIFTKGYLILMSTFLLLVFFNINLSIVFSILYWPAFFGFFIIYLRDLSGKLNKRGNYKTSIIYFLVGFGLIGAGFLLNTDIGLNMFGIYAKLYGNLIQLAAISLLYVFLSTLPSLSEFEWQDKVESIFLMDKSGICIYSKLLHETSIVNNEQLVSGAITSINLMLDKLTDEQGLSVIKKGEEKITIICPGEYITGVIISTKDLKVLRAILQNFVDKIESLYSTILDSWDGDTSVFSPVENICKDMFIRLRA